MVFELILTGLCAFVLSPCDKKTDSVTAVFPAGPFDDKNGHQYKHVHRVNMAVDVLDIDGSSSTWMPDTIVEDPDGVQYAVFALQGPVTTMIDSKAAQLQIDSTFTKDVTSLSEVVSGKPELGKLKKSDMLTRDGNELGWAHLTFPVVASGGGVLSVPKALDGTYDFHGDKPLKASDHAKMHWETKDPVALINKAGKKLVLRDGDVADGVHVVLSSLVPVIGVASKNLEHFPMYYFLSTADLKKLKPDDWKAPKPTPHTSEATKPVACAICQGCGG